MFHLIPECTCFWLQKQRVYQVSDFGIYPSSLTKDMSSWSRNGVPSRNKRVLIVQMTMASKTCVHPPFISPGKKRASLRGGRGISVRPRGGGCVAPHSRCYSGHTNADTVSKIKHKATITRQRCHKQKGRCICHTSLGFRVLVQHICPPENTPQSIPHRQMGCHFVQRVVQSIKARSDPALIARRVYTHRCTCPSRQRPWPSIDRR